MYSYIVGTGGELKKRLGWGFSESAAYSENGVVEYYRTRKELAELPNFFKLKIAEFGEDDFVDEITRRLKTDSEALIKKNRETTAARLSELSTRKLFEEYAETLDALVRYWCYHSLPLYLERDSGIRLKKTTVEKLVEFRRVYGESYNEGESVLKKIFVELAKKSGVDASLLEYALPEELWRIVESRETRETEFLRERKNCFFLLSQGGKISVYGGEEAAKIKAKEIKEPEVRVIAELRGTPAFAHAPVKGIAKIIRAAADVKKIVKGDVLVSTMTHVDLVPAMRECVAIVTDEGGMSSHAAIVAREFKIPCVVGTRVATKIFKDGDVVEVDASAGVVRKIK